MSSWLRCADRGAEDGGHLGRRPGWSSRERGVEREETAGGLKGHRAL